MNRYLHLRMPLCRHQRRQSIVQEGKSDNAGNKKRVLPLRRRLSLEAALQLSLLRTPLDVTCVTKEITVVVMAVLTVANGCVSIATLGGASLMLTQIDQATHATTAELSTPDGLLMEALVEAEEKAVVAVMIEVEVEAPDHGTKEELAIGRPKEVAEVLRLKEREVVNKVAVSANARKEQADLRSG